VNQYTAPNPLIRSTVAEAVSASDPPLDKARKLYALVTELDNIDIAGGSHSAGTDFAPPGSAETVLERKSGNGEEIALLYLSLARAADSTPGRSGLQAGIAASSRPISGTQANWTPWSSGLPSTAKRSSSIRA